MALTEAIRYFKQDDQGTKQTVLEILGKSGLNYGKRELLLILVTLDMGIMIILMDLIQQQRVSV